MKFPLDVVAVAGSVAVNLGVIWTLASAQAAPSEDVKTVQVRHVTPRRVQLSRRPLIPSKVPPSASRGWAELLALALRSPRVPGLAGPLRGIHLQSVCLSAPRP
jgi:hypothetical protein